MQEWTISNKILSLYYAGGRRAVRSPDFTFDDAVLSPNSKTKDDELLSPDITGAKGKRNRKKKRERLAEENKVCKCETCGIEGDIAEFRSSGRFLAKNISQCVGRSAHFYWAYVAIIVRCLISAFICFLLVVLFRQSPLLNFFHRKLFFLTLNAIFSVLSHAIISVSYQVIFSVFLA